MSILVYTESENGIFKNSALEAMSYAKALADQMKTSVTSVVINTSNAKQLEAYGATKILNVNNDALISFNAQKYAASIISAAKYVNATVVILSSSANSKYIAPIITVNLEAAYVSNVTDLPTSITPFVVKRNVFTNKAKASVELASKCKIIGLWSNSFGLVKCKGQVAIENFAVTPPESSITTSAINKADDNKVNIADADIVVSGGRGLKGPENWHLINDLAMVLNAATACSKPVSDLGWRPHSEHVGQTGKSVVSNLYIAIGISGAIQHLAGINASKIKVVINNDPEAPFFKFADYGIVGDAFEVVPKLIEKLKAFKPKNP